VSVPFAIEPADPAMHKNWEAWVARTGSSKLQSPHLASITSLAGILFASATEAVSFGSEEALTRLFLFTNPDITLSGLSFGTLQRAGGTAMDSTIIAAVITGVFGIVGAVMTVGLSRKSENRAGKSPGKSGAYTLDSIVDRLDRHRQRATYGAVAGLLGRDPYTLFDGYPFTPRNSWVVAKATGLPTKFTRAQMHADLEKNVHIITTSANLESWLLEHR
jgi:hypothetical protein